MDDEQIYLNHRDDLIRYATVLVGPTAAEDVVSVVVMRVLSRRRLSDLAAPRPYLFRAVLNEWTVQHNSTTSVRIAQVNSCAGLAASRDNREDHLRFRRWPMTGMESSTSSELPGRGFSQRVETPPP